MEDISKSGPSYEVIFATDKEGKPVVFTTKESLEQPQIKNFEDAFEYLRKRDLTLAGVDHLRMSDHEKTYVIVKAIADTYKPDWTDKLQNNYFPAPSFPWYSKLLYKIKMLLYKMTGNNRPKKPVFSSKRIAHEFMKLYEAL